MDPSGPWAKSPIHLACTGNSVTPLALAGAIGADFALAAAGLATTANAVAATANRQDSLRIPFIALSSSLLDTGRNRDRPGSFDVVVGAAAATARPERAERA